MNFYLEDKLYCPQCGDRMRVGLGRTKTISKCANPTCEYINYFNVVTINPNQVKADYYISPAQRIRMPGAGALGTYSGPVPLINYAGKSE